MRDKSGIEISKESLEKAIGIADAFYGDEDSITLKMRDMKKPVMIQNYDIV